MEGKPYSRNTKTQFRFRAGQIFVLVPFKESRFPLFEIKKKSIQAGKRSCRSITERSCPAGIDFITKPKRPISSKDLEVLYAANQLGLNAPKHFANSAWFNTILYFRKRGRENQREMKPGDLSLAQNNNKLAEVLHLKRESDENSVHLQVLQIIYTFCVSRLKILRLKHISF